MQLKTNIKFADERLRLEFERLENGSPIEKERWKSIQNAFTRIEENAFSGTQIQKRLIPKEYIQKQNIRNLWKYNLPEGWRLLYSIKKEEVVIISLILEWLPHKGYEKRLKY